MTPRPLLIIVFVLLASACASTAEPFSVGGLPVEAVAASQIEGSIADEFGLPLVADCPVVDSPAVGSEFQCTASTSTGQIIDFVGLVAAPDRLDISSTNVVSATALNEVRAQLATDLSNSTGYDVAVDCPANMITMDAPVVACTASTPDQPDVSPIGITFTDARSGSYRIDLTQFALFDPVESAKTLITTELSSIIGVPLTPVCPEQINSTVGEKFRCTGETPDGRVIEFLGEVDRLRHIDMTTTNFLREEVVQAFEVAAADALAPQTLTDTTVDCQPRPVLFTELGEIRCVLTLGNEDQLRTAVIEIEDFATLQFVVAVENGAEPVPEPDPEPADAAPVDPEPTDGETAELIEESSDG